MVSSPLWISGPSRSGKTTRLIELLEEWGQQIESPLTEFQIKAGMRESQNQSDRPLKLNPQQTTSKILVLAANSDNRMELLDRISQKIQDQSFFNSTTPLGFFEEEVTLFWPLLIRSLKLRAQFPLRLRPETEQELARRLWSPQIERGLLRQPGLNADRMVRRFLDLFQLAAFSATPTEDIQTVLEKGLDSEKSGDWLSVVQGLQDWRNWCLERGLLTYGIISELYWRYLLPDTSYQQHLTRRYPVVLADDVDEYPAIAKGLFDFLLSKGATGGFTYNPNGGIRLGLGADPDYLAQLQQHCQIEELDCEGEVLAEIGPPIIELATAPYGLTNPSSGLPDYIQFIQTKSRGELLRETAEIIIKDINSGRVQPQEVAVIAPGLDAIARYTLISILTHAGIPVQPLKEQRSLVSYPRIRALLTLLTLVYPGLGRLADRDAVAEMLVVLSERSTSNRHGPEQPQLNEKTPDYRDIASNDRSPTANFSADIDPVRAGMLADSCFYPDVENPRLLEVKAFPRWDLLGYRATNAYEGIVEWIEEQRSQQQQLLPPSPIFLLDRAIQKFFMSGVFLPYEQLAAIRELMETSTHYWEVDRRLKKSELASNKANGADSQVGNYSSTGAIAQFIGLLRRGAIGANPFPVRAIGPSPPRVTLATIFQYRVSRQSHRWQFWLDAGSSLWLSGGAATLFAAPFFLQGHLKRASASEDIQRIASDFSPLEAKGQEADLERLRRILIDLLSRVNSYGQAREDMGHSDNLMESSMSKQHRIYLCHSELAVNGQEQTGPLLPLVYASVAARPSFLV